MQDNYSRHSDQMESFVTEGTLRVTGVEKDSISKFSQSPPDPEVSSKTKRRQFSKAYKLHILDQWDKCTQSGQKAALLRREGLYTQTISNWLKQRKISKLKSSARPVNTSAFTKAEKQNLMRLELENEKLKKNLAHAEKIIDLQKKRAELLNLPPMPEDQK